MGARHQLFVIARMNDCYRRLATLHHQWLSRENVLKRCLALQRVFRAESNRNAIQQELVAAKSYSAETWQPAEKPLPDNLADGDCGRELAPFPFIATCLLVGTSFSPIEGHQSRVHPLDHKMPLGCWDNNEGMTILDISHPEQTSCCFASLGHDDESENMLDREAIPMRASLSASSYFRVYGDRDTLAPPQQAECDLLIQELERFPLVDNDSLRTLWENAPETQSVEVNIPSRTMQSPSKYSLKDTAVDGLLKNGLNQPQLQGDAISEALQVPGVQLALEEKLYTMAESKTLEASLATLDLMLAALSEEAHVDLGPFRSFSSSDLCYIISKLQEQGNMISLNFSNNPNIQESDLLKVFDTKSCVQTIYLLGDTSVPYSGIRTIAKDPKTSLHKVYHIIHLQQSFTRELGLDDPKDTQYVLDLAGRLPLSSPNRLVGAIWISIDGTSEKIVRHDTEDTKRRIDWQKIAADERKFPDSLVPRDLEIKYGIFPLHDTTRPPIQMTNALINFTTCVDRSEHDSLFDPAHVSLSLAKSIASASSSIDTEPMSSEIAALPPALFAASSLAATSLNSP